MNLRTRDTLMASFLFSLALGGCASYDSIRQDKSLYQDLGGQTGVAQIATSLIDRARANPRIKKHFEKTDIPDLKKTLTEQLCELTGGPCQYKGKDMAKAHKGLDLGEGDFNALVEDLRDTFDALGTPHSARNRLLALLAPMKRDMLYQ